MNDDYKITDPADQAVTPGPIPHPGQWIRENVLEPVGLNISAAAREINMDRATFNRVILGEHAVSDDLAYKLEALTGVSAELLINMQRLHDRPRIDERRARYAREIRRVEPVTSSAR